MIKNRSVAAVFFFLFAGWLFAQNEPVVKAASEAAEGLDLGAVGELFKDAENLEAFEKSLNDPETGVNNLDLDEDGTVDFLRVVEEMEKETHVIVLQAVLGENEFQDVATIEVEKTGEESYSMQVHGDDALYGEEYYVAPTAVYIHTWPLIRWIYRPHYRPYVSLYRFGHFPPWWVRRPPVAVHVYHSYIRVWRPNPVFAVTRTSHVKTVHTVKYKPHSSTLVKKTTVVRPSRGTTVKKTTVKTPKKTVTKTRVRR